MALTGIESLVGNLFNTTFGLPIVFGIIGMLALVFFLVSLKLPFDASLVIILPFLFILNSVGYLPTAIYPVLLLGVGVLIFLAVQRLVRR